MKRTCIIGAHETMFSQMVACIIRSFDTEILIKETRNLEELFIELDGEKELIIVLDPYTFGFNLEAVCKKIYTINSESMLICLCQERCNKFLGLRLYRCGVNSVISTLNNSNELVDVMKRVFEGIGYYPKEILDSIKRREHFMMSEFCSALTARELEILSLLVERKQTKYIAISLGISAGTIWSMTSRIVRKLGATSREEAIKMAINAEAFLKH